MHDEIVPAMPPENRLQGDKNKERGMYKSMKEHMKPTRRAHKSKILHRASNRNMGSNAPRSIPIGFQIAIDSLDSIPFQS